MEIRSGRVILLATAVALTVLGVRAQEAKPPMEKFVLIFLQTPREFTEADLKKRSDEVRVWVQKQTEAGRKLDPRILVPEGAEIGLERVRGPLPKSAEGLVSALLFVEAESFESAVEAAKTHPGVSYGARVQVRPWGAPTPPK